MIPRPFCARSSKTDDVEVYNAHVKHFVDKFQPATYDERILVQDLADTEWRLLRIPSLEAGVYAVGRVKLAHLYENEPDETVRNFLIEADVCMTYRKDLNNLSLQHTRLRRHRLTVVEELNKIQHRRKSVKQQNIKRAADYYLACLQDPDWPFHPSDLGFVFSMDEMFRKIAYLQAEAEGVEFPEVTIARRVRDLKAEYAEQRKAAKN